MTIREIIAEERRRLGSADPAERFAAALLIPAVLRERLRRLRDAQVGQLLGDEVWPCLSLLAPESTVCLEAVDRLRRLQLGEPASRPACPECGGEMHFRFGIDGPDTWECDAASCGHRL